MSNRIKRLFLDWYSVQDSLTQREAKRLIERGTKDFSYFNRLVEMMGVDGDTFKTLFKENMDEYGEKSPQAKRTLAETIIHDMGGGKAQNGKDGTMMTTVGQSYYPIADRSNQMETFVREDALERDIVLQIRNAVMGGNLQIAEQLLNASWSRLTLKERNGLIEWVNHVGGQFNTNGHKSRAPKLKPVEKRSDVKKEEFINGFLLTAKENMIVS